MKILKFLVFAVFFAFGAARAENLIVYFSDSGNTERVANTIYELVGGDVARIVSVMPYPKSQTDKTYVAKREQESGARPEYEDLGVNVADYDLIFLGYPIWWGGMPMVVYTFLENNNFDGKVIVPFATYGTSGLGNSVEEIKRVAPGATVTEGFGMPGKETTKDYTKVLAEWLSDVVVTEWLNKTSGNAE
ncbi:MAG: flavodoxin [Alphaproteobacteria bacterium]|nr:flavodoxin [Alphaproteobacteria bacterium]